ncbi:hypothetical protein JOY44_02645 [Phormidium sp. CLA17]|uniref:hypothetical protein n=1 Tax=Leptolyngbya sp. Cla-17 TaxID=2803751 RepID=UPI001490EA1B|nr:hypothetical protein [Leptolyngbya sp. Cla-17]MBM0740525.1 hypothetical protein [Leptolyngbya sp. Cla-17]
MAKSSARSLALTCQFGVGSGADEEHIDVTEAEIAGVEGGDLKSVGQNFART